MEDFIKPLKNYFYYSRSERNGVIVLLCLCLLLLFLPALLSLFSGKVSTDFTTFKSQIVSLEFFFAQEKIPNSAINEEKTNIDLVEFNPNTATKEKLEALGLSPKIAQTILNYRSKGGFFRQTNDLKKIYGLTDADFARISPYVVFENEQKIAAKSRQETPQYAPQIALNLHFFDPNIAPENELLGMGLSQNIVTVLSNFRHKGGFFKKKEDFQKIYGVTPELYRIVEPYLQINDYQLKTNSNKNAIITNTYSIKPLNPPKLIDLNDATEADLLELRGIGRTFAARIVEYRTRLGGFVRAEQLKEISGIADSTYQQILPLLNPITTASVRKFKINRVAVEEFRHPYITRKQAEIVIRYRTNHSIFTKIEDLQKVGIMSNEGLERLRPYLDFD